MHGLAAWLRANGHDATILAGHSEASTYEIDGVPYRTVRAPDWSKRQRELTPAVTMIPGLARALHQLKPDVVHAFSYHDAIAARLARRPYLISYAGIIVPASWKRAPQQFKLFKYASRHAGLLFCPTRACGDALKRDYGFGYELLAYGLATKEFAATEPKTPGRIMSAATPNDSRKRPEFLVQAFGLVAQRDPAAHLVFCAAAREDVQGALRALLPDGAKDRVQFLGNIPRDELVREFARAEVTALTSLNEAFGLVQIESLAAGTPVVATRSGAVPEVINESVGGMFEPDDVAGCAAQIERLLRESGPELSQRCVDHARTYDWDVIGPRTVALYQRVARVG